MQPEPHSPPASFLARLPLYLAALWLAAGALFKLFKGSPNDLPPDVLELGSFLEPLVLFRTAIAVELCIVATVLLRPRLGWLPLVGIFLLFDAVLVPLVRSGASSCGCFGGKITIPPWVMMTVDSTLLLGVLAARPWKSLRSGSTGILPLVPLFAVAIAAPLTLIRGGGPPPLDPGRRTVQAVGEGTGEASGSAATEVDSGATSETEAATEPSPQARSEAEWPDYWSFEPSEWIGKNLDDQAGFAPFLRPGDLDLLPLDGRFVFYRPTCDHCAAYLQHLALEQSQQGTPDPATLVLVRIPDSDDTPEGEITTVKPEALASVELHVLERGYGGFLPPAVLEVEGYVMRSFKEISHEDF